MKRIALVLVCLSSLPLFAGTNQTEVTVGGIAKVSGTNSQASGSFDLQFQATSIQSVLQVYAQLKGKTLLQHPLLSGEPVTFKANPATQAEAVTALETMFKNRGVAIIPDGENFV